MNPDNSTDEDRTKCIEINGKLLDALENRFKDGRKYCAGGKITAADFSLLTNVVGFYENPHGKVPALN